MPRETSEPAEEAFGGSTVNLFGTAFFLDGVEVTDLALGETLTIADRNVKLTGFLADGSAFDFDLFSFGAPGQDSFSSRGTLTVTLVPAPGSLGLLAAGGLFAARRRRR